MPKESGRRESRIFYNIGHRIQKSFRWPQEKIITGCGFDALTSALTPPGKKQKYLGCQSRDTKKLPNYYSAWARLTSWRQNLMTLIYFCLLYSQISVNFYSLTSCQMNFQKIWPNIFERSGKKKFGEALHFFLLLHLSSFSLSSFFSVSCFAFFPTFCLYPMMHFGRTQKPFIRRNINGL